MTRRVYQDTVTTFFQEDMTTFFQTVCSAQNEHISEDDTYRQVKKSRSEEEDRRLREQQEEEERLEREQQEEEERQTLENETNELLYDVQYQINDQLDEELIVFDLPFDNDSRARLSVLQQIVFGFSNNSKTVALYRNSVVTESCCGNIENYFYNYETVVLENYEQLSNMLKETEVFVLEFNTRTNKLFANQVGTVDNLIIEQFL